MSEPEVVLKIRNFSIRDRRSQVALIRPSTVELHREELVLLVGMSGSGKSLLCNLMLGTVPREGDVLQARGSLLLEGVDLLDANRASAAKRHKLGAVFQLQRLGLFDDLSVDENIAYAAAGSRGVRRERARHWRKELGLESAPNTVDLLSGGQQQRLAMARTLEAEPDFLLYDEPTTGLDPEASATTVRLIQSYHKQLTLVVTHDYRSFAGVATRVLFIDPTDRSIKDLADEGVDISSADALRRHISEKTQAARKKRHQSESGRIVKPGLGSRLAEYFVGNATLVDWEGPLLDGPDQSPGVLAKLTFLGVKTGEAIDRLPRSLLQMGNGLLQMPYRLLDRRIRTYYSQAMQRFFGVGPMLFIAFSCALIGLVATHFTFDRLPLRSWTEPIVVDDLLNVLGFGILRVLAPLLTAILLSAKVGARVAATTGSLNRGRQVDAMRLFGVSPTHALLTPTVVSYVVGFVMLVGLGALVASAVSLLVFIHGHPGLTPKFWWGHYARHLTWINVRWMLAKTVVSAVGAALIAHDAAMLPKQSARDLGHGIHRTVLFAMFWVLAVHAVFAFFEFPRGGF